MFNKLTLPEFADRLSEIMPELARGISRHESDELYEGKITLPQFLLLTYLEKHSELRMTDLANYMAVSTAAMTGIIERLVKSRYVIRKYDPDDRRTVKIIITAKGLECVRKIRQARQRMIIKVFAKISESDRQEYLRILIKIRDIVVKEN